MILYAKKSDLCPTDKINSLFAEMRQLMKGLSESKKGNLKKRLPDFELVPGTGIEPELNTNYLQTMCVKIVSGKVKELKVRASCKYFSRFLPVRTNIKIFYINLSL